MYQDIAESVHNGLYVILICGIAVIFKNDIRALFWRVKMTRRLRTRKKNIEENRFYRHLDMLAKTTLSARMSGNDIIFFSVFIFMLVSFTGMRTFRSHEAVIYGLLIGVMPYVLLRIKLEDIRHKASFEGERFITVLLSKYRMSSLNMQNALELMIEDDQMPEICKKTLAPVILKARMTGDRNKIKEAFREFDFTVNTNWSRMASYNIAAAFSGGTDVTGALEDIMMQLREAKNISEERKRLNSEAGRLVMFMVPVSYIFSLFMAVRYAGVSFHDLMINQFFTTHGFGLFIFILFMFLLNTALLKIVRNRRFDY